MELSIDRLTKHYGRKIAVDCVSTVMKPGVYGLLGENGAGKTTLMRMLCAILEATSGEVFLDGKEITALGADYRGLLGYLPQDFGYYPNYTAKEFLLYMAALKGIPREEAGKRADELLEVVGLSEAASKKVKTFSGGMKRRIGIAQAIINEPKILILDEPTAGLDPKERIRFSNIISDMGKDKIVLLSTHIVSDIEAIATELVVVKKGKVLETGNVDELVRKVEGQVWETVVSQEVYQKLRKERSVIHLKQMGREVQVRFVGEEYPDAEGSRAEPTLEDYYVFAGGIMEENS